MTLLPEALARRLLLPGSEVTFLLPVSWGPGDCTALCRVLVKVCTAVPTHSLAHDHQSFLVEIRRWQALTSHQ